MKQTILFLLLAVSLSANLLGQERKDTMQVLKRIQMGNTLIKEKKIDEAIKVLDQAIDLAAENEMPRQKAMALQASGKAHSANKNTFLATNAYLHAAILFEGSNDVENTILCYTTVGHIYFQRRAYQKAADYYNIVLNKNIADKTLRARVLLNLAKVLVEQGDKQRAVTVYEELLDLLPTARKGPIYYSLVRLHLEQDNFALAETVCLTGIDELKKGPDVFRLKNALIFIYNRQKNFTTALIYVKELEATEKDGVYNEELNDFYLNSGVTYSNLENHTLAKNRFYAAHEFYQSTNNRRGLASTMNYIAADLYLAGAISRALAQTELAIETAKEVNALKELTVAYQLKEKILSDNNATARAKQISKKIEALQPQMQKDSTTRANDLARINKKAVEDDAAIRQNIAKREEEARELRQFKLEDERKANELKLLKQSQELQKVEFQNQKLEKEKLDQMYDLLQSQARTSELEKNKEIQNLMLQQKEAEEQKKNQQIKLLEQEKAYGALKLEEEKKQKRYAYILVALAVGILSFVVVALFIIRRSGLRIKEQNRKIGEQKEELEQQTEELLAQRQELQDQRDTLSFQHGQISASIRYAQTIQAAILPSLKEIDAAFNSSFVLFRPKDVVSGDYYWFYKAEEQPNTAYIATVDCTGHGVPGAFMSLVGSRIMNELVMNQEVHQPNKILEELDSNVRSSLKQDETENRDGMDLIFCKVEYVDKENAKVTFASAKRPLIYHDLASDEVKVVKGGRRSIGGANYTNKTVFEQQTLSFPKGTTLYLTSDGYVDQNGTQRKKIGTPRFLKFIDEVKHKPLDEQHKFFSKKLNEHMQDAEQRDDITVLAFKL